MKKGKATEGGIRATVVTNGDGAACIKRAPNRAIVALYSPISFTNSGGGIPTSVASGGARGPMKTAAARVVAHWRWAGEKRGGSPRPVDDDSVRRREEEGRC